MKIAIMGIRGIPANYGGFETFAEELSTRLVERGHEVTVYGRSNSIKYKGNFYRGVRLVILPTISHKYLDTVAHTFLCALHSIKESYDVVLICNSANASFAWIPRTTVPGGRRRAPSPPRDGHQDGPQVPVCERPSGEEPHHHLRGRLPRPHAGDHRRRR